MIIVGDCIAVMPTLPADSFDSIVTDPPYGIRFMGKAWDGADIEKRSLARRAMNRQCESAGPQGGHNSMAAEAGKYDLTPKGMLAFQEFTAEWARAAFRVLKPGGFMVVFASTRTYHRMVCGVEEAGFEIRDQLAWVFGSGFPKSHNGAWGGTALKPAWEPILLARKPLVGTVEANHALHGTGGLNIDACRIEAEVRGPITGRGGIPARNDESTSRGPGLVAQPHELGRWPANLVHDGSDEVMASFPTAPGQRAPASNSAHSSVTKNVYGSMKRGTRPGGFGNVGAEKGDPMPCGPMYQDAGSAARFFYCAKASREDRDDGLEEFELREAGIKNDSGRGFSETDPHRKIMRGNHHPTVKPTELMRWLCRLVTPAGGHVLDPFAGSGSTGRAASAEGMQFTGIELSPEYAAIAEARTRAVQPGLSF